MSVFIIKEVTLKIGCRFLEDSLNIAVFVCENLLNAAVKRCVQILCANLFLNLIFNAALVVIVIRNVLFGNIAIFFNYLIFEFLSVGIVVPD